MHATKVFARCVVCGVIFLSGCGDSDAPTAAKKPSVLAPPSAKSQANGNLADDAAPLAVGESPGTNAQVSPAPPLGPSPEPPPATPKKPARADEHLFVDWPAPLAAIVITGEQLGYLEPCGCAGLENQKGGLARRYTLIKQLREKQWPVVAVDLGGLIHRFGQQAEMKFQIAAEALKLMDYAAIGLGPEDLRLPAGVLAASVASTDGGPSRFVDANVGLFAVDSGLTSRWRIVEAGGKKIGITAVLADDLQKEVGNGEVVMTAAEAALAEIAPKLEAESDFRVLLSFADPKESARLAKLFDVFHVVATAHGAEEPPAEPLRIEETPSEMVEVGHKGMFAVVIGVYDDRERPIRYQRVPIDSRFSDAPEMVTLRRNYQQQLETLVTSGGWDAIGAKARPFPGANAPDDPAGKFVGSKACADCHTKAYAIWAETPHAHATETLVKLDPPRQFDPECVSCHATGWNPQEFYPYTHGYVGVQQTPQLMGNGCENCHGPGGAHVAAEQKDSPLADRIDALRAGLRLTLTTAREKTCAKCHDLDNSPEFDFTTYWPQVEHKGKD
ncbi:MAG TPA: multiheme c-type cytochrome [Pirellulales bacterium]|nr:multiheme c-type cytochrome [Pirellulales bacterium]